MEQTCPHCQRVNLAHAAFCASCGQPLERTQTASTAAEAPRVDGDAEEDAQASAMTMPRVVAANSAARRAELEPRAGRGARLAVIIAGIAGGAALAAATGVKMATHRGRALPPQSAKLRALPPPSSAEPEEPAASQPAADDAQPSTDDGQEPAPVKAQGKGAPKSKVAKQPTPIAKDPTPVAKVAPKPKPKPKPLGPPPTDSEINTCINKRKPRLRACADEAAQRMEDTGYGTARATLNPDGKFTSIRVPGGGYFATCATQVIRGLRCRAFRGEPVEVRYPIR
jgi:hypothetical protein